MMPVWWRWMYWADPAAWTVYGLVFSQLGDRMELIRVPGQPDQPVREFLEEYLGLQDDYFPLVTALHIALSALFSIVFCISIKYLWERNRPCGSRPKSFQHDAVPKYDSALCGEDMVDGESIYGLPVAFAGEGDHGPAACGGGIIGDEE